MIDLKLSPSPKLLLSFKINCLKWNTKPMWVLFLFFTVDFSPLLIWVLVSTLKEKLGYSRGFAWLEGATFIL